MAVRDGSFAAWASSVPPRATLKYGHVLVSRSGLDDLAAADLSAGRPVFLPWAKPKFSAIKSASGLDRHGSCTSATEAGEGHLASLSDFSVFVASCQSASLTGLMGWFRAEGASLGFDQNLPRALSEVAGNPALWSALIVHADGFGDLEDLVDMLLAFRRAVPALPLILISAGFGRDNLGSERLALCDVSLRDPVGLGRMKSVLDQAIQHNRIWQQRLATLAETAPQPARTAIPRTITPRRVTSERP